jgi:DNA ligase-1
MKKQGILPSFVNIVEMTKCEGKQHLLEYFKEVTEKGGEGVILREPSSLYKGGRSDSLKKYKSYLDTEVRVIENNYPHGFFCQLSNGKTLFVGLVGSNNEDAKKIKEGTVITVKHLGSNVYGTLQYPKFYRERTDVNWEDIIKT